MTRLTLRCSLLVSCLLVAACCLCCSYVTVEARPSHHHHHRLLTTKQPTTTVAENTLIHLHPHSRRVAPETVQIYVYGPSGSCDTKPTAIYTLTPYVCSTNVPPNDQNYLSWSIQFNNQTNLYELDFWEDNACVIPSFNPSGQGNECIESEYFSSFRVISPILAPCTYTKYADSACTSAPVTQFGMSNGCVYSSLAEVNQLLGIDIDIEGDSFTLTCYPTNEPCQFEVIEWQLTGSIGQCVNNGTITCNNL